MGVRERGIHRLRWRRRAAVAVAVTLALAGAPRGWAFETDQYLALEVELADSAAPVNAYLNRELTEFLDRPAADRLTCEQVPTRFYRHLFRGLMASRFQKFLKSDPSIDLFPDDLSYREYKRRSVYRRPSFPYVMPLSPTIRIGEVRFGLDKFGHLFGFGRRYYKRFVRLRSGGLPVARAVEAVVRRGLYQELTIVGGLADGVFSYSDLEANFQGMELARHFCEGERPYISRSRGRWKVERRLDLRRYVTPSFDESYYNNHYPWPRWKKVRPILESEYCEPYFSSAVQARMERYRSIDRDNASKQLVHEYFERKGKNPQRRHSMEAICPPPVRRFAFSTSY